MDRQNRDQWIAELRSGKYRQGRGQLRTAQIGKDDDLFCCLGVLIDVLEPHRWMDPDSAKQGSCVPASFVHEEGGGDDRAEGEFEGDLWDMADIDGESATTLISMNDGERWHEPSQSITSLKDAPKPRPRSKTHPEFVEGKEPQGFGAIANWIEKNL